MANEEHMARVSQGVDAWNAWRRAEGARVTLDLSGADLSGTNLLNANLSCADLSSADLSRANLRAAYLNFTNLVSANLSGADLNGASLMSANLSDANLEEARLSGANLSGAALGGAELFVTVFGDLNLSGLSGLESCRHVGASIIDHQTLQRSGTLPLPFLRGVSLLPVWGH
jgi:uncharacterized protein YjbI with pentapeptide repeats